MIKIFAESAKTSVYLIFVKNNLSHISFDILWTVLQLTQLHNYSALKTHFFTWKYPENENLSKIRKWPRKRHRLSRLIFFFFQDNIILFCTWFIFTWVFFYSFDTLFFQPLEILNKVLFLKSRKKQQDIINIKNLS